MSTTLSFRMAYQHVRAGFGRMALSVLVVALGVGLVVAIQLMNSAVLASFLDTVDGMVGRATFSVTAGDGLTLDADLVHRVAAVPGVKLAVPLVTGVAFPDDGSGELLTVHGVDLADDAAVRVYHRADTSEMIDDLVVFLNQPDSIVLGREFADRRGLRVGSRLDLVTPGGVKPFTVRGLLDPEGLAKTLGGRLVVMDLYAAELAFTAVDRINQIDLLVEPGKEAAAKAALAAVLPAGLRVEEPALRKEVLRKTVGGFQAMLTAFALLAVVAGFVICYSRLAAIFEARTWIVGLLRAVGLRRGVVFTELLKESLLLGLAGAAMGIPLGVVIGHQGLPLVATFVALNYRLPVPAANAALTARALVLGVIVGLGAAVLAAAVPAMRVARRQPVAALTMRGRDMPVPDTRVTWGLALGFLVIVAGLVWLQVSANIPTLGNVTTALVALGVCAGARPLVEGGGTLLTVVWRRVFGPTGEFAAAHLGQQARRASLTIATFGIGLGAILMFGLLAWSFERTLVSQCAARLKADLIVTSAFVSGGWMNAPVSEVVPDRIAAIPGVAVVAAEQRRDIRYGNGVATLDGYDPTSFRDQRLCQWPLEAGALPDPLSPVARGEAVIVSTSFARQFGIGPGDMVELSTERGLQRFRVTGITRTEPTSAIIMSRDRYKQAWDDTMVTYVHVALSEGTGRATVEQAIARELGQAYRLRIQSGAELIAYLASQARQAFRFVYLMEAITFALVLIGIGDTLATGVLERTREFGMMRAVGLRRSRLFEIVVLEGLAIGVLGLVLALCAGLALGLFWVEVQFPALLGWDLDLHFPYSWATGAAALTMALCLVGSLLPSLRAARLTVPAALRNE